MSSKPENLHPAPTLEASQGGHLDPNFDYALIRHKDTGAMCKPAGPWEVCGEVKDSTADPQGTMIAVRKPKT